MEAELNTICTRQFFIISKEVFMTDSMFSLTGKVALVTGGTSGIGNMIAKGLVKQGAKVYVASRKAKACEDTAVELSQYGECIGIAADLSTEQGCIDLVEAVSQQEEKLHVLVNNAGATWGASLEEYPAEAWDRIHNLNVKAAFIMTQKSLPLLEAAADASDPARVINITSVAGKATGSMNAFAYGPSKAALDHLTRILANELAPRFIAVNAIAPGVFPSKMTQHALQDEKIAEAQRNEVPLKRLGEPKDMEALAVYLSCSASSYMTGNVIYLDGGANIASPTFFKD